MAMVMTEMIGLTKQNWRVPCLQNLKNRMLYGNGRRQHVNVHHEGLLCLPAVSEYTRAVLIALSYHAALP